MASECKRKRAIRSNRTLSGRSEGEAEMERMRLKGAEAAQRYVPPPGTRSFRCNFNRPDQARQARRRVGLKGNPPHPRRMEKSKSGGDTIWTTPNRRRQAGKQT